MPSKTTTVVVVVVVVDVLVVVEDVVALGGSDVSGTEDVVVEVVLVLLVVVVVSATGAGGKPCASTTLPDGSDGDVSVGTEVSAVATASVADVDTAEPLSSLLSEEQAAASKTAAKAIAMQNFAFITHIICRFRGLEKF